MERRIPLKGAHDSGEFARAEEQCKAALLDRVAVAERERSEGKGRDALESLEDVRTRLDL